MKENKDKGLEIRVFTLPYQSGIAAYMTLYTALHIALYTALQMTLLICQVEPLIASKV